MIRFCADCPFQHTRCTNNKHAKLRDPNLKLSPTHPLTDSLTHSLTGGLVGDMLSHLNKYVVSTSNVQMNSYMPLNVINAQLAPR